MTKKKNKKTENNLSPAEILLQTSKKCSADLTRILKSWSDPATAARRITDCAAYLRAVDRMCSSLRDIKPNRLLRSEGKYYLRGSRHLLRLQEFEIMVRGMELDSPYAELVANQLHVRASDWITDIQDRLAFFRDKELIMAAEEGQKALAGTDISATEIITWFEEEASKLKRRQRKSLVKVRRKTLEKSCRQAQACALMQKVFASIAPGEPADKTLAELIRKLEVAAYWRRLEEFLDEFTLHSPLKGHKGLKKETSRKADSFCTEADEVLSQL